MTYGSNSHYQVIIIGAGAAGLMCAIEAGRRGRRVLVLEHNSAAAEKIRISGGGRCNFTNLGAGPENFLSQNPRFAISALKRFDQHDFTARIAAAGIGIHEKTLGQLFCDGRSGQIINMLLADCARHKVEIRLNAEVTEVAKEGGFQLRLGSGAAASEHLSCDSLVVACGGKSIPKMGASDLGYRLARQFGLGIIETRPGLVPLTLADDLKAATAGLAGISALAEVATGGTRFREALLFTHRGLSGPAILQISSFWRPGAEITIDLAPGRELFQILKNARAGAGKSRLKAILATAPALTLPARLLDYLLTPALLNEQLGSFSDAKLRQIAERLQAWRLVPIGSEGYRTAEVTVGGVDTAALSSKSLEAKAVPGLYFIGEVVDVTGWLGGYNFQWAWSSGHAAGQVV